jgi:hypothetical protein
MFPIIKKDNLSLFKLRWHLGRRGSKSVHKHDPRSPIHQIGGKKIIYAVRSIKNNEIRFSNLTRRSTNQSYI